VAPQFLIFGGPNGAGKSTITRAVLDEPEVAGIEYFNADVIAKRIRLETGASSGTANFGALREVAAGIERALSAGTDLATETVLANNTYRTLAQRARASGFVIRLVFVTLDTVDRSIERVARRVVAGGHAVPEADLRRRWPLAHANLGWFCGNADWVDVFDNSVNDGPPRHVAAARDGQLIHLDARTPPAVLEVLRPLLRP